MTKYKGAGTMERLAWGGAVFVCAFSLLFSQIAFGEIRLVSTDSAGIKGISQSQRPDVSADGRYVVFLTSSSNLKSAGSNSQVVVKDTLTGAISTISLAYDGSAADGPSSTPVTISADGRYVTFSSLASNLVPDDTNGTFDLFWHDRQTGETQRINIAPDGSQSNGSASFPAISGDGRFVAFRSRATNLVSTTVPVDYHVYVRDMAAGTTRLVSRNASGAPQQGGEPDISSNGRWVTYRGSGSAVYWVDTLNCADTGCNVVRANVDNSGNSVSGHTSVLFPKISGNGGFVTWESNASGFVSGDTNGVADIFVRDIVSGVTSRVSVATNGIQGDGDSLTPDISDDGRYVTFTSAATNLAGTDTNSTLDVFRHDRHSDETVRVSLTESGSEANNGAGYYARISGGGTAVAFSSASSNLVAADTDTIEDVYLVSLAPPNTAPVAEAGANIEAAVGDTVTLNGLNSYDDTDAAFALAYQWNIVSLPQGSEATLSSDTSSRATIVPDLPGTYQIELVVTDNLGLSSASDTVEILAGIVPGYMFKMVDGGSRSYSRSGSDYSNIGDVPRAVATADEELLYYNYQYSYDSSTRTYSRSVSLKEGDGSTIETRLSEGQSLSSTDTLRYFSEFQRMGDGTVRFRGDIRRDEGSGIVRYIQGVWELDQSGALSQLFKFPLTTSDGSQSILSGWNLHFNDGATIFQQYTYPRTYRERTWLRSDGTTYASRYYDQSVYIWDNGDVREVWNTRQAIPGKLQEAHYVYIESLNAAGDVLLRVGYPGESASNSWEQALIKVSLDGSVETIMETSPSGVFPNYGIGQVEFDGQDIVVGLSGRKNGLYEQSIYRDTGAGLEREIAGPYLTSGTGYQYLYPWIYSLVDGNFLFSSWPDILAKIDGRLRTVVRRGEPLDGVTPQYISANPYYRGRNDLLSSAAVGVSGQTLTQYSYDRTTGDYSYAYDEWVFHGKLDTDRDLISDDEDNCPSRPNTDQADGDGDGVGDVCEDSDADGQSDELDNCPLVANSDQLNSDTDAFGDACDVCELVADDQSDFDGDGVGDACDTDRDNDSVDDVVDNCPVVVNPAQADLDGDGLGNLCDDDKDGDGIANVVDGTFDGASFTDESEAASGNFTDQHRDGSTFGQLLGGNNTTWTVDDASSTGGVLISADSQGKLRRCDENMPITWPGGAAIELTCTSTSVRTLYGLVEIAIDDDEQVIASVAQGSDVQIINEPTGEFAVLTSPASAVPVVVNLRDEVTLEIEAATGAIVEEPALRQFMIESAAGSDGTIAAMIGDDVVVYGPGDSGIPVAIDIKPGEEPNAINLGSSGNIPVAIFSSVQFDATSIDPLSVTLAQAAVRLRGKGTPQVNVEDVDGDGIDDVVVHVDTTALELAPDSTSATLEALTFDGLSIRGNDSVVIVPE